MTPHQFDPTILRMNDIRGVVDKTLFEKDAYAVGQCLGTILNSMTGQGRIVLGYDGRLHSPKLAQAMSEGLTSTGQHVLNIGLAPTPMVNFAERHLKADGAVTITGSHNPSDFNGFKMSLNKRSLMSDDIQAIGRLASSGNFSVGEGFEEKIQDLQKAYIENLLADFTQHYSQGRALKVAWDSGNGATGAIVEALVKQLPGEHVVINSEVDGTFPNHHPDPTVPKNMQQLCETVIKNGCDLGIGFDGDGDRIGVVDNTGQLLWGDQLLLFYAEEVAKAHPGCHIISDIKASQVLFNELENLGAQPVMWKTGHSLIKSKMIETKAPLAGEMSGHVFFADRYSGFDDALYAALRIIGPLSLRDESLSQWLAKMPPVTNTPEIRFECPDDKKFKIVEEIRRRVSLTHDKYIDIDGIRLIDPEGWWLLRASNTQNALIARVEASSEAHLNRLKDDLKAQLSKCQVPTDGIL